MKLKNNIKAPNFKLPSTNKTIFELNKIGTIDVSRTGLIAILKN